MLINIIVFLIAVPIILYLSTFIADYRKEYEAHRASLSDDEKGIYWKDGLPLNKHNNTLNFEEMWLPQKSK